MVMTPHTIAIKHAFKQLMRSSGPAETFSADVYGNQQETRNVEPLTRYSSIAGGFAAAQERPGFLASLGFASWFELPKQEHRRVPTASSSGVVFEERLRSNGVATKKPNSRSSLVAKKEQDIKRRMKEMRSEIEQERSRHTPDRAEEHGMEEKPKQQKTTQVIYDRNGKELLKGEAVSREALIAEKCAEFQKSGKGEVVSLANADLRGMNFQAMDLSRVDLRGADLSGSSFEACEMSKVDMSGADLRGATFDKCVMDDVRMTGFVGNENTKFSQVAMHNVAMDGAFAPGIQMKDVSAEYLNMAGSDFRGAQMDNVVAENLWAVDVNLSRASISGLQVSGPHSSFKDAHMEEAKVYNASFGTVENGVDMSGVKGGGMTLKDVNFHGSDVSGMQLNGASFEGTVDMRNVKTGFNPVNLDGASVAGLQLGAQANFTADKILDADKKEVDVSTTMALNEIAPEYGAQAGILKNRTPTASTGMGGF